MMRDAGIAVVRLGHLAWDTFEPADGEFRFEWFDEVMDLMRDNGIGVILDIAVWPAPLWPRRRTSPRNLRYIQISRLPRPRRVRRSAIEISQWPSVPCARADCPSRHVRKPDALVDGG
jgi:hypothetical protein